MNRDERAVLAAITDVNSELGRYVLRLLDVTNGLSEAGFSPERETALGDRLVVLGQAVRARARQRATGVPGEVVAGQRALEATTESAGPGQESRGPHLTPPPLPE